jgi:hypothetical protein
MNIRNINPNITECSEKRRESQEKNGFTEVREIIQFVEV